MSFEPDSDESASATDSMEAAEVIASDLDDFEAFLWPIYRDRGFTRETAVLCFYLHLNVVETRGDSE